MKSSITYLLAGSLLLAACGSNTNSSTDKDAGAKKEDSKTITDAKLQPFMLGGVYFFHGYGGGQATFNQLFKAQMSSKPGDDGFMDELHKVYTEYFYYPFKQEEGAAVRQTLDEAWGMKDKATYTEGMADLLANGHQTAYERLSQPGATGKDADEKEQIAFIKAHQSEFPKGGIRAWDIARYVNNTAQGYAAGYITKDEGDAMLAKLWPMAHQHYSSWPDYWKGYNLGRKFWAGDTENDAAFDNDVTEMQQGDYSMYEYMKW